MIDLTQRDFIYNINLNMYFVVVAEITLLCEDSNIVLL